MASSAHRHMANYGDCVASLRTSLSYLEGSVSTLENGVSDMPRLSNVLKSVRHYELIPQPTLAAAEASLRDEIGPAIAALLDRADAHIGRVERRVDSLRARAELQQGRLLDEDATASARNKPPGGGIAKKSAGRLDAEARLRARVVRQRKEALKYSVERLELQALQKERELRKRLEQT